MAFQVNFTELNPWGSFRNYIEDLEENSGDMRCLLVIPIISELTQNIKERQLNARISTASNSQEKLYWQTKKLCFLQITRRQNFIQSLLYAAIVPSDIPLVVDAGYVMWNLHRLISCSKKINDLHNDWLTNRPFGGI